jgi:alpha-amylase
MERLRFLFGVHCHQPIGNFGFVFEKAYQKSYLPFFELLGRHPRVKCSAHFSGCLLDWIFERHPEFIDLLRRLSDRGQVEMVGGGYYEPILAVLPERDQRAQLDLMNQTLERTFGRRPSALWLTERVWEPQLPAVLAPAGIRAVFVDDSHFFASGKMPDEVHGHFTTDHLDHEVEVFPISEKLRYLIPFAPVEEVFTHLQERAEAHPGILLTMVDDGEKFGTWPKTWDWVFGQGWLERFFEHLAAAEWVRTVTVSEALRETPSRGTLHMPTLSYMELGEWALPVKAGRAYHHLIEEAKRRPDADRVKPFIRGGYWRMFFDKYEEARWMYRRMVLASNALAPGDPGYEDLLKSQCNCAYWHGIFGGLYLPFLKREIFSRIVAAEAALPPSGWEPTSCGWRARTAELQAFFSPACGGILEELDTRTPPLNLLGTCRRRVELYHELAAQAGGGDHASIHDMAHAIPEEFTEDVREDPHPRKGLIVHQFSRVPESLNEAAHLDVWKGVREETAVEAAGNTLTARSERDGWTLTKTLTLDGRCLTARVAWNEAPSSVWSVEMAASPAEGFLRLPGSPREYPLDQLLAAEAGGVEVIDTVHGVVMALAWGKAVPLRVFPLRTVSLSEDGFERIQQGVVILPMFTGPAAALVIDCRKEPHV